VVSSGGESILHYRVTSRQAQTPRVVPSPANNSADERANENGQTLQKTRRPEGNRQSVAMLGGDSLGVLDKISDQWCQQCSAVDAAAVCINISATRKRKEKYGNNLEKIS